MKQGRIIEIIRRIAGTILLIIGIIGIFIPLFPDIILIIIGSSPLGSKLINKRIDSFKRELTRVVKKEIKRNKRTIKENLGNLLRKFRKKKKKRRKIQRIESKVVAEKYENGQRTNFEREKEIIVYPRIFRSYKKVYPNA